jgi:S1-C subfamily serine protease
VAEADIVVVTLYDGSNYQARIIGSDAENDLAVLKFDPAGRQMQNIIPGNSRDLQVGQKVLALGNPFGLEGTLTTGIISGINRPLRTEAGFLLKGMIQTDAAINPGNSGGALLNSMGELIGINTMIISPGGMGSVGIGFAIPVETAMRIVPELIETGRVNRGWIEIEALSMTPNLARQLNTQFLRYGVLVTSVLKGGNADKAGLKGGNQRQSVGLGLNSIAVGGDIITSINDRIIKNILQKTAVQL